MFYCKELAALFVNIFQCILPCRYLWLLFLIMALASCVYICLLLSATYTKSRLVTVISNTRYPVYNLAFPVVTICNINRLNWRRLEDAKKKFLPDGTNDKTLNLFERVISTYDDLQFRHFTDFAVLANESLDSVLDIDFSEVYKFMTWRCSELLKNCQWQLTDINCCDVFSLRHSKNGLCWSFNSLETNEGYLKQFQDDKWPWHVSRSGPGTALKVRIVINPEQHYPGRTNFKGSTVGVINF